MDQVYPRLSASVPLASRWSSSPLTSAPPWEKARFLIQTEQSLQAITLPVVSAMKGVKELLGRPRSVAVWPGIRTVRIMPGFVGILEMSTKSKCAPRKEVYDALDWVMDVWKDYWRCTTMVAEYWMRAEKSFPMGHFWKYRYHLFIKIFQAKRSYQFHFNGAQDCSRFHLLHTTRNDFLSTHYKNIYVKLAKCKNQSAGEDKKWNCMEILSGVGGKEMKRRGRELIKKTCCQFAISPTSNIIQFPLWKEIQLLIKFVLLFLFLPRCNRWETSIIMF